MLLGLSFQKQDLVVKSSGSKVVNVHRTDGQHTKIIGWDFPRSSLLRSEWAWLGCKTLGNVAWCPLVWALIRHTTTIHRKVTCIASFALAKIENLSLCCWNIKTQTNILGHPVFHLTNVKKNTCLDKNIFFFYEMMNIFSWHGEISLIDFLSFKFHLRFQF